MQAGTQILIDRMKSHPEEFKEGETCKWSRHISYAMEWLPEEDKQALREAINQRRIETFNEGVFKELAGEPEPEEETITYKSSGRYGGGWTDPAGIFGSNPLTVNTASGSAGLVVKQNGNVDINGDLTVKGKIHVNGN